MNAAPVMIAFYAVVTGTAVALVIGHQRRNRERRRQVQEEWREAMSRLQRAAEMARRRADAQPRLVPPRPSAVGWNCQGGVHDPRFDPCGTGPVKTAAADEKEGVTVSRSTTARASLINGEARAWIAEGFGTGADVTALMAAIEKGREERGMGIVRRTAREAWRIHQERREEESR
jgi:hypothetical protein